MLSFRDVPLMDLRGIEPLSESLSLKASPITVADLTFPQQYAHRQAYCFSSFMIHLPGQSLPGKVSHMVDARFPMCECNGADEQLRLLTLTFRLRLYLVPGWYAVQESADGFPNFSPSKPVQALKDFCDRIISGHLWWTDELLSQFFDWV